MSKDTKQAVVMLISLAVAMPGLVLLLLWLPAFYVIIVAVQSLFIAALFWLPNLWAWWQERQFIRDTQRRRRHV
jgi:hypothetical protein